jgi:hypothetical protein
MLSESLKRSPAMGKLEAMKTLPETNSPIEDFPAVYGHLKRAAQLEREIFGYIGSEATRLVCSQVESFEAPGLAPPVALRTFKDELAEIEANFGALLDAYRRHISHAVEAIEEAQKKPIRPNISDAPF